MSIASEIERIQADRDTIRTKLVELGLATSTSDLDALAEAIEGIEDHGAATAVLDTSATSFTIPAGYHDGSGKVSVTTETKSATPTKSTQTISASSGKVLKSVSVAAIPSAYQNVSSVTAGAEDVLANKIIVASDGKVVTGTMPNNGTVEKNLDTTTIVYDIPRGYHSGEGYVKIDTEEKSATPSTSSQSVTPSSGKVLSKVTVNAIPAQYKDVSGTDALAVHVLDGKLFVSEDSESRVGTMPNRGEVKKVLSAADTVWEIPEGYHNGEGDVQIITEERTVTPSKSSQTITANEGKVISKVTVGAISSTWFDVSGVTAAAANVLSGKYFVTAAGVKTQGTMANNGAISKTINALTTTSASIPAGYTSGGTVSLTADLETALKAI